MANSIIFHQLNNLNYKLNNLKNYLLTHHNAEMHSESDKTGFSKRLKVALELAGLQSLSLAEISNKFNLRHPNKPVTPQAVHNWLIG